MRPVRVAALTAALVVLSATAASAHPSFNPNAVPVGEAVEATLVVPHGCSTGEGVMPEEGEAVPTTRFDLQLVDGLRVEPQEVDGWVAEDDGEAIVWTADGGATSGPVEFPVTLTVTGGSPGDQLEVAAYQECEDGSSYQWTAGAEGTPPVRLELTEGETGTVDHGAGGHGSGTGAGTEAPSDEGTATGTPSEVVTTDAPTGATELDGEAAAQEDDGSTVTGLVVGAVVALLAIAAAGLVVRRRAA